MPAFPCDPTTLERRCIGTTMAYLKVVHEAEGSHFKVHKGRHTDEIYKHLVESFENYGIHLPPKED